MDKGVTELYIQTGFLPTLERQSTPAVQIYIVLLLLIGFKTEFLRVDQAGLRLT